MRKKSLVFTIVLLLVVSFSGLAHADGPYTIGFQYIQKRIFEHNKSVNMLAVSMRYGVDWSFARQKT